MDTLICNLIEEVDDSRSQMFDILENIALEQAKMGNLKKKNSQKKKNSSSFIDKKGQKMG